MAKYRALQRMFLAPELIQEGQVFIVGDDIQISPLSAEPLDAAAEAVCEAYYKKYPGARMDPVEDLPGSMDVQIVDVAAEAAKGSEANPISLAEATTLKAAPGPTDGGKVK